MTYVITPPDRLSYAKPTQPRSVFSLCGCCERKRFVEREKRLRYSPSSEKRKRCT
jgi:hypothetical protein